MPQVTNTYTVGVSTDTSGNFTWTPPPPNTLPKVVVLPGSPSPTAGANFWAVIFQLPTGNSWPSQPPISWTNAAPPGVPAGWTLPAAQTGQIVIGVNNNLPSNSTAAKYGFQVTVLDSNGVAHTSNDPETVLEPPP